MTDRQEAQNAHSSSLASLAYRRVRRAKCSEKGFPEIEFSSNIYKIILEKEPMKTKLLIQRIALRPIVFSTVAAILLVIVSGCKTSNSAKDIGLPAQNTNDVVLKPGDVVKIVYPNGNKMDVQTIRPDGKITLMIIGDVTAAGNTPEQFRQELVGKYSNEIVSSQAISVVVQSYAFPIYVTGAVLHPGKITGDHTLTVLEAIMEAGGFDPDKAQLKSVKVVRTHAGKTQTFVVNLKGVQTSGAPVEIFYLQPNDIVMVPQKLVIF